MRRSEENSSDRHLIDDDDLVHIQSDIKDMMRFHYSSFEDILAKMGSLVKQGQTGNVVTLSDFENVVQNIPKAQARYSNQ